MLLGAIIFDPEEKELSPKRHSTIGGFATKENSSTCLPIFANNGSSAIGITLRLHSCLWKACPANGWNSQALNFSLRSIEHLAAMSPVSAYGTDLRL